MFRMAVGHSDDIDPDAALEAVFAGCDAALAGATPKAGLLLAAWEADHQALLAAVRRRYPDIEIAGSSTAGEMTSVLGFQQDSIALALFASDAVDVTSGLGDNLEADPEGAAREAVAEARSKTALAPALCIALPTIGVAETGAIIKALRAELGPDVPVLGGGAAPRDPVADPAATSSHQFAGDRVVDGGISILLFSGPLAFSFGVETGWRGVGPRATVTRVGGGRVLEIDGRRAVDFFERYLGPSTGAPPIANPLAVFETSDSSAFYLRTATNLDLATGAVSFFGTVPDGATVQFTVAATDEIVEGARTSISSALESFPIGGTPEAALLYSCATRRFLLGTRAGREIDLVRAVVGQSMPVAGFYCLGEIAPLPYGDVSQFHNATLVAVLLGSPAA
jgi:hypothetical protein